VYDGLSIVYDNLDNTTGERDGKPWAGTVMLFLCLLCASPMHRGQYQASKSQPGTHRTAPHHPYCSGRVGDFGFNACLGADGIRLSAQIAQSPSAVCSSGWPWPFQILHPSAITGLLTLTSHAGRPLYIPTADFVIPFLPRHGDLRLFHVSCSFLCTTGLMPGIGSAGLGSIAQRHEGSSI
jgi:hypothetical protein